jgi:hypothetical protein
MVISCYIWDVCARAFSSRNLRSGLSPFKYENLRTASQTRDKNNASGNLCAVQAPGGLVVQAHRKRLWSLNPSSLYVRGGSTEQTNQGPKTRSGVPAWLAIPNSAQTETFLVRRENVTGRSHSPAGRIGHVSRTALYVVPWQNWPKLTWLTGKVVPRAYEIGLSQMRKSGMSS